MILSQRIAQTLLRIRRLRRRRGKGLGGFRVWLRRGKRNIANEQIEPTVAVEIDDRWFGPQAAPGCSCVWRSVGRFHQELWWPEIRCAFARPVQIHRTAPELSPTIKSSFPSPSQSAIVGPASPSSLIGLPSTVAARDLREHWPGTSPVVADDEDAAFDIPDNEIEHALAVEVSCVQR